MFLVADMKFYTLLRQSVHSSIHWSIHLSLIFKLQAGFSLLLLLNYHVCIDLYPALCIYNHYDEW